ncbi:MAG: hypothetical protein EBY07_06020 [Actinobacteria bacterium]|nr:hypothetical protein [Actinomycetota bacterium]
MQDKFDFPQNDVDTAFQYLKEYLALEGFDWNEVEKDSALMVLAKTRINEMSTPRRIGKNIISILKNNL